jgi:restriction system protein
MDEKNYAAFDQAIELLTPHILTLIVKRSQTVYKDDYGNEKFERWLQEIDYFIDNVLVKGDLVNQFLNESETIGRDIPEKTTEILRLLAEMKLSARKGMRGLVDHRVNLAISEGIGQIEKTDVADIDGISFEHHCADMLRNSGWEARVTQSSADQGIDIIASRGGMKGVFQCKKYSQPVGNSAVQEVIAGKVFERASFAVVVSNNSYTQSARQLANAAGVHLIHFSELPTLADKLGLSYE